VNKTPIVITIALFLAAALASALLWSPSSLEIEAVDLVNAQISVAACLGALVSATFVVFSHVATNKAYVEAQRPHLLIQVENLKINDSSDRIVPYTRLHYRNITTNRFKDLTLIVTVTASNRKFVLSDLFRSEMTMIGLDSRQRNFDPVAELRSRGLELQQIAAQGIEVRLDIGYTYTFNGKSDHVDAQTYRWDAGRDEWSIL